MELLRGLKELIRDNTQAHPIMLPLHTLRGDKALAGRHSRGHKGRERLLVTFTPSLTNAGAQ